MPVLAAALDPRFKGLQFVPGEVRSQAHQVLRMKCTTSRSDRKPDGESASADTREPPAKRVKSWLERVRESKQEEEEDESPNNAQVQRAAYFAKPAVPY